MSIHLEIERRLRSALSQVFPQADPNQFRLKPCPNPVHGDYQCSGAMALAKSLGRNPRQIAQELLAKLDVADCCAQPGIAGAGFLNFTLLPQTLAASLASALKHEAAPFLEPAEPRLRIVIDFSSPNVAKAMHVGHIRSTVLGDCLARVYRKLGHEVITDNHIGDWGTQFGKLLVGWKNHLDSAGLKKDAIAEMERLYRHINQACEQDPTVLEAARQELVQLQNGNAANRAIWEQMIELSQCQFDAIYTRLGVRFDHALGESFYNPWLKETVQDLANRGIAEMSEGAFAVFFPADPGLKDHPALIQKSDGAANYTTTDLATLAYRLRTWNPDRIVYVTDGRQQLHFRQLFAIFAQWRPDSRVRLDHVWFGSILGADGKPFRTRAGDTIRLADLLDEAEERAFRIVTEKSAELAETQGRGIARAVGLGAVKYSDLLPNRQSDYVFDWDKMLALNGNTAPYLQYACARIHSIFRKGAVESAQLMEMKNAVEHFRSLAEPVEIALAKHLLNFGIALEAVAEEARPNYLCNYLYELAGRYASFYEGCPVLKAEEPLRTARLGLCLLAGRVLKIGLETLGIEAPEQM